MPAVLRRTAIAVRPPLSIVWPNRVVIDGRDGARDTSRSPVMEGMLALAPADQLHSLRRSLTSQSWITETAPRQGRRP